MDTLLSLKPTVREHVFDLAEKAGFDVSDWVASSKNPRNIKANPKYCYQWSYLQPGRVLILNLWFSAMIEENGRILQRNNFREDFEYHRTVTRKSSWAKRAKNLDDDLQTALENNLPVRVIVNDGVQRGRNDPKLRASSVKARKLDPEPWVISKYDRDTGAVELTRGIFPQACVDQFDLELADKAAGRRGETTSNPYIRDPAVRDRVKARSQGKCELCGRPGFAMPGGAVYLETHHVLPLSGGGDDADSNVVALCADDHRKAHYSVDREAIAQQLTALLRSF